ncbi:hypothetical protein BHM03_00058704 [Ensete ventricosum]|nr:hypothetical protein BHM03_00058704 [Ensete ventricosum]
MPLAAATCRHFSPPLHLKRHCHPLSLLSPLSSTAFSPISDQCRHHLPYHCYRCSHLLPSAPSEISDPSFYRHCTNVFPLPLPDATIAAAVFPFPLTTVASPPHFLFSTGSYNSRNHYLQKPSCCLAYHSANFSSNSSSRALLYRSRCLYCNYTLLCHSRLCPPTLYLSSNIPRPSSLMLLSSFTLPQHYKPLSTAIDPS